MVPSSAAGCRLSQISRNPSRRPGRAPPFSLSGVRCQTTPDPATFWEHAERFLLRDPVVNNVLITNVLARRAGAMSDPAPATYAVVLDATGAIVGAAMRTPPHPILASALPPEAAGPLAEALVASCPDAAGVNGPAGAAAALAAAWHQATSAQVELHRRERMHRLDDVIVPRWPSGCWRGAGLVDRDFLLAWSDAFEQEAELGASGAAVRGLDAQLAEGRVFLWIDGPAVSYVGTRAPVQGVVRVGPVYTPPERRGRGYASALVAAVSSSALEAGATACMLYTDMANRTANDIYAAIGYRPVAEVSVYRFQSAAPA